MEPEILIEHAGAEEDVTDNVARSSEEDSCDDAVVSQW
mgnify:CR=1 FL=1